MEKNKMKKNKSQRKKLFLTRCAVFAMLLLMLLPMLCSMAFPVTITISNPDNVPYEYDDFELNGNFVTWGTHQLSSPVGNLVTIIDGFLYLTEDSLGIELFNSALTDGQYTLDIGFASSYDSTSSSFVAIPFIDMDAYGMVDSYFFIVTTSDITNFTVQDTDGFDNYNVINTLVLSPYEAPPTPTESITNVWTGITEWFMGALNSVQGLFITTGVAHNPTLLKAGTYRFNDVLTYPSFASEDGTTFAINFTLPNNDDPSFVFQGMSFLGNEEMYGLGYCTNISTSAYEMMYINMQGWVIPELQTHTITQDTEVDETFGTWYIANTNYNEVNGNGQFSLTFLGTLAVIGVAIGVAFLLIATVRRFLSLRS